MGAKMTYELRPYQQRGSDFLVEKKKAILGMDPGLGKTLTTLDALSKVQPTPRQILLIAGVVPQSVWEEEVKKWGFGWDLEFVMGTAKQRETRWNKIQNYMFPCVVVTTIQSLQRDIQHAQGIKWDCVIMDECHKARNRKTKNYDILRTVSANCPLVYLLSGSIVSRGPQDLWAPLSCLDRKQFPSYWNWINKYCHVIETYFGNEIGGPKNIKELRDVCGRYIYYKPKSDPEVSAQIPGKNRQLLTVHPSTEQRKLYDQLTEEMIATFREDLIITPSKLSMITRHRQLLVCPRILFQGASLGTAFETTMEMIEESSREDKQGIIYRRPGEALTTFKAALEHKGHEDIVTFQGGMSREEIAESKRLFVSAKSIALMSIAYAESISLESASYGYFIGADWDQNVNYQAEDRIHRLTSTKPCFYYYFNYPGTISEWQFEVLGMKTRNQKLTLGTHPSLKILLGRP